jgi:hypothetical protein
MVEVEATDEFRDWFDTLEARLMERIIAVIDVLQDRGPNLREPYCKPIKGSRHTAMHELRTRDEGNPVRIFFCFDPRRQAILLIGGDKTGDPKFYDRMIPIADDIYDDYLNELRNEGLIK